MIIWWDHIPAGSLMRAIRKYRQWLCVCGWLTGIIRNLDPISPPAGRPADDDDNSIGVVVVLWGIERCTVHVISLQ